MNTGQTMLTIIAMLLLSTIVLSLNRGNFTTSTTIDQNRINILAVSLATSIIEDATSLPFDEKTIGAAVTATTSLSGTLGIEGSESASNPQGFDDFDDYNCYASATKKDTILVPGSTAKVIFHTFCNVIYVSKDDPRIKSAAATWHKKISLRVFRPGMNNEKGQTDTIKMSSVYSYWYFR